MPIVFRPAAERGRLVDPGVAGTAAFSHGSAFDRDWLGFHALRVLNRVELAPGAPLPAARRANMEVLTLVLAGTYHVQSQAGDSGPVAAGQWHRLGAGAGVDAVEQNLDPAATLRLLQLWVQPTHSNAAPAQAVAATRGSACWIEVIGGELAYRGQFLRAGDGLGVADEAGFALVSSFGADLLVVELPA